MTRMEGGLPERSLDVERAVRERYGKAALDREPELCCAVDYEERWLEAIPEEVVSRDYGCGDPSRYVREGDTVLDLGSGAGKICFIAAQIAGPRGKVIGVDFNDEMLGLARGAAPEVARRIGYDTVSFRRGRIQDLQLDLDLLDAWMKDNPVSDAGHLSDLEDAMARLRRERPLVPDGSVDIVVSNCVLNLVAEEHKARLMREIFRVLRKGGRIAISDIVSDEEVPAGLKADPELWSGCVTGAFTENRFLSELETVGFHGITIDAWKDEPFRTVEGIEFRSVTVTARKGKEGPCLEANQAVIYRGPWKTVEDDDGHVLRRGERAAVCEKTYGILTSEPYGGQVVPVPPRVAVPAGQRRPFDCARTAPRHPRETKGEAYAATTGEADAACCGPDGSC